MYRILLILLLIIFSLSSCKEKKKRMSASEARAMQKPLENINRHLLKQDEEQIRKHCERRGWGMEMTNSGLWYGKLKSDSTLNEYIVKGDLIELKFKVELLNGKLLYTSDSLGTKVFEAGHGGVENGLEEGVLLMKENEKFRFIMPPHKAFGLLGDMNKIPARSIIVYYVEVIRVEK